MTRAEYVRRLYEARYEIMRQRAVDPGDATVHLNPEDFGALMTERTSPEGQYDHIFSRTGDGVRRTVFDLPLEVDRSVPVGSIILRWEVLA